MEKRYSCDEVAEMYGVKKLTVWAWIRAGRLNAIRPGKNYFIRREDLEAFEGGGGEADAEDT